MTTLTLRRLFERLKKSRTPDRALDRAIHIANGKPCGWLRRIPHYTQSFEAALTLLPPVVYVEVSGGTDTFQSGVWPAVSLRWLPPGQTDYKKWNGTVQGAPTFALAMCLAAIEVRDRLSGETSTATA